MTFKILSLSDLHLGNRLVSAESIIYGLNRLLPDDEKMAEISAIFLVGDIFDEALLLADTDVTLIQLWIVRILKLCAKWDIMLRVLEGTPKHDRAQSSQFLMFKTALNLTVDFKYADTLSIEYVSKYNIHILYVPDEWKATTKETEIEVKELLITHNLKQVDYALMHGCFLYQLPYKEVDAHSESFYLSIVKRHIFIGHVHDMSQYDIITAHGSTDRIGHGHESPKGIILAEVDHITDTSRIVFIVNEYASIFKTVDISKLPSEKAERKINNLVLKLQEAKKGIGKIHIRIQLKRNQHIDLLKVMKTRWVDVVWTSKFVEKENTNRGNKFNAPAIFQHIPINKNTINDLMGKRIEDSSATQAVKDAAIRLLGELI
jgi:hypothetical protein